MGFRWLEISQNGDGGWGIEYRPYAEEGRSRVSSTFHAIRALSKCGTQRFPEEKWRNLIERGALFHFNIQDEESGGWGFLKGSLPNIYNHCTCHTLTFTL